MNAFQFYTNLPSTFPSEILMFFQRLFSSNSANVLFRLIRVYISLYRNIKWNLKTIRSSNEQPEWRFHQMVHLSSDKSSEYLFEIIVFVYRFFKMIFFCHESVFLLLNNEHLIRACMTASCEPHTTFRRKSGILFSALRENPLGM